MRILFVEPEPALADPAAILSALLAERDGVATTLDVVPAGEAAAASRGAAVERLPYRVAFLPANLALAQAVWTADPRIELVVWFQPGQDVAQLLAALPEHQALKTLVLPTPLLPVAAVRAAQSLCRKWDLERLAEEGFDQVFNASPLPQSIIALDTFEVIAVNHAYEKMIGYTAAQLRGATPESFGKGLNADRWRALLSRLNQHEPVDEHPFTFEPAPGRRIDMRCSARALTVRGRPCSIWVVRDVTQQLRLEEQARQAQKMDAIGQLASGVAHDFNNLLTAIHGFTSQAMMDTADEEIRALLEPVLSTSKRAAALTRQLLIFGRQQPTEIRPLDIGRVAADLKTVLRRLMSEHIELLWDLPEALPPVMADVTNIEQIIVNLAINARDALPERGGTIRISAGTREFASDQEAAHVDGKAGKYVMLQVGDNGSGIAAEVLSKIFDPFFTTKAVGRGTGLGLSTVYSAARQHGGWVDVQSAVGLGTVFTVYHPALPEEAARKHAESGALLQRPNGRGPGAFDAAPSIGRVLAVDDDPSVQSVLRLLFDRYGIDSRIAADAPGALQIWDESAVPFDILITDMVMPNGCNGAELATQLRLRKPDLRVVLMTGYSSDVPGVNGAQMPGPAPKVLIKPFELTDVLTALGQA